MIARLSDCLSFLHPFMGKSIADLYVVVQHSQCSRKTAAQGLDIAFTQVSQDTGKMEHQPTQSLAGKEIQVSEKAAVDWILLESLHPHFRLVVH